MERIQCKHIDHIADSASEIHAELTQAAARAKKKLSQFFAQPSSSSSLSGDVVISDPVLDPDHAAQDKAQFKEEVDVTVQKSDSDVMSRFKSWLNKE